MRLEKGSRTEVELAPEQRMNNSEGIPAAPCEGYDAFPALFRFFFFSASGRNKVCSFAL